VECVKENKCKVLIIVHSHAKKCAAELQHNLNHRYEVYGFIQTGATSTGIITVTVY
jgi:hypothetical protein